MTIGLDFTRKIILLLIKNKNIPVNFQTLDPQSLTSSFFKLLGMIIQFHFSIL